DRNVPCVEVAPRSRQEGAPGDSPLDKFTPCRFPVEHDRYRLSDDSTTEDRVHAPPIEPLEVRRQLIVVVLRLEDALELLGNVRYPVSDVQKRYLTRATDRHFFRGQ